MKVLATVKPVYYLDNKNNYAFLIEVDVDKNKIIRELKIPSASFHTKDGFMTNFAQGLAVYDRKIYLSYWNYIAVVDYDSFRVIDAFSHPLMSDVHGIACDENRLFAASTNLDALLCFDRNTYDLLWRWGPDKKILSDGRKFWSIKRSRINRKDYINTVLNTFRLKKIKYKFIITDYRNVHKSRSPYHNHHLNDVAIIDENNLYITTKGWNNFEDGRIIKLNLKSGEAGNVFNTSKFKGFQGLHDCEIVDDAIYVTESSRNQVSWIDKESKIHSVKVEENPYFVRGLCYTGSSFLVGFSSMRNTNHPAKIVEFDQNFKYAIGTIYLDHLYPKHKKSAVHAIIKSPIDINK